MLGKQKHDASVFQYIFSSLLVGSNSYLYVSLQYTALPHLSVTLSAVRHDYVGYYYSCTSVYLSVVLLQCCQLLQYIHHVKFGEQSSMVFIV
jgi:hypothetical protein